MTRRSLEALRRTVTVEWPAADADDARRFLVATARRDNQKIIVEQTARGGVRPGVTAYANHPGNPNLDTVVPPGPIVHLYDYREEIAAATLKALIEASPRRSGDYIAGHTVFVNGAAVATLPRLAAGDIVMIANPVPYARRLEIGRTKSGRSFVLQVPDRIYERVAKNVILPRYRNVARIEFTYVDLAGAATIKGGLSGHYTTGTLRTGPIQRKRRQKVGEPVKSPAILIKAFA